MLEIGHRHGTKPGGGPSGRHIGEQTKAATIRQRGIEQATARKRIRPRLLLFVLPAALALSGCVATPQPDITNSNTPSQAASAQASSTTTSAPLETTQASNKAPVYWIGRSNENMFLYREFRDVPEQDNPVTRALRVMMSQKPLDPDFFTPWQNPKKLASSISGKNVITVDMSPDAFNSNVDAAMAERAIQQLVYTATAAAASAGLIDSGQQIQVVVLVDGHTDYVAFNHVRLGSPTSRSAGMVAPVWIIDPQEGTSVGDGAVKVFGRSTAPGGQLRWEVLRIDGSTKTSYLNGTVTASAEGGQSGTFSLSVNLGPGEYEVRVSQLENGNPATNLNVDTRGFRVK
ncbi:MAG: GerMN domain-containing protein [Arthrobacter sp.]